MHFFQKWCAGFLLSVCSCLILALRTPYENSVQQGVTCDISKGVSASPEAAGRPSKQYFYLQLFLSKAQPACLV